MNLHEKYKKRYEQALQPLAERLQKQLEQDFQDVPRIDRISARAKDIGSFISKAHTMTDECGEQPKYKDPLNEIQDQLGARVIVVYLEDVDKAKHIIDRYHNSIEDKIIEPDSEKEFDYVGRHYILHFPEDLLEDDIAEDQAPNFFELQIKTLFQHAWSEANHDLGYKSEKELRSDDKRKIAFTAAQAWGADHIFDELLKKLKNNDFN
jgi:ppGpp synthetase/RelA/SpoT-type nucleotidyltranferase